MRRNPHIWRFFRSGGFDQVRIETSEDLLALKTLDQKLWVGLSCPVRGIEMDSRTLQMIDLNKDGVIRAPELLSAIDWVAERLSNPDVLTQGLAGIPLNAIQKESEPGATLYQLAERLIKSLKLEKSDLLTVEAIVSAQDALIAKEQAEWLAAGDQAKLLGDETEAAYLAFQAVAEKIDDYFARCQLAGFDSRSAELLDATTATYSQLTGNLLTTTDQEIAALPIARVSAEQQLNLHEGINPAWQSKMATFLKETLLPLEGEKNELTLEEWQQIKEKLTPFGDWMAARPELSREAKALADLEKLGRLVRDLLTFTNNFVSFKDFYTQQGKAIFQAGTLYLDRRSAELCIKVDNVDKHSAQAAEARMFLVYCDCVREGNKMTIAAAFTDGDSEYLTVGRNGLFYDRKGLDWNATVVKVVDYPISLRQAFWSPYKKFSRMVAAQFQKIAANKESQLESKLALQAEQAAAKAADSTSSSGVQQAFDVGKFAGIFAAIGLALGALGTALAAIVTGLLGLVWWKIILVVAGVILIISGPSVVLTWFRLRSRRLGPLLDANGWAINAHALINIPFGTALTQIAHLPEHAERSLEDPYAPKGSLRKRAILLGLILILIGIVWYQGWLGC